MNKNLYKSILFGLTLTVSTPALAIDPFTVQTPSSVNPGQLEQRFQDKEAPKAGGKKILPDVNQEQKAPARGEEVVFTLKGVNISGSTVYEKGAFQDIYNEFVGKEISLAQVFDFAAKITARYRNDGYILSRAIVPPQRVANGIIEIQAIEGFIDQISFEGEIEGKQNLLNKYASRVKQDQPLRAKSLERFVLLTNDLPGVSGRVVLLPSPTVTGASDVVVVLTHDKYEHSLTVDNRGSRFLGPIQLSASVNANSLLGNYEQLSFRHVSSTQRDEFNLYEVNYEQPFGPDGLKFNSSISRSLITPGYDIKQFDVQSDSTRFTAGFFVPLLRTREENFSISTTFDYRDSVTTILNTETSQDRIRSFKVATSYDFLDSYRGINLFNLAMTQGLDVFHSTPSGSARLTRAHGKSDFTKFNLDMLRLQNLAPNLNLYLSATGQYSIDQLLSSEEFGYGGAQFGRAYDPSEITGDHGFSAQAELRYQNALSSSGYLTNYELFTFYDFGAAYRIDSTDGKGARISGASVGAGVRFGAINDISGTLEVALPLTRSVETRSSNDAEKGDDPRVFFSVIKTF